MKNREKFPKTEDAIKAYEKYSLSQWDARPFEAWAEAEAYEPVKSEEKSEAEAKGKDDNGLKLAASIMSAVAIALNDLLIEEKASRLRGLYAKK